MCDLKYFCSVCGLSFHFLKSDLCKKFLILMKSNLSNFYCAFPSQSHQRVNSKNSLHNPRSQIFSPMFSPRNFIVLGFTLKSMIHLGLFFCINYKV